MSSRSMTRWLCHLAAPRGLLALLACAAVLGGTSCKSSGGNRPDTGTRAPDAQTPNRAEVGDAAADATAADHPADALTACSTDAEAKSKGTAEACSCDSECRTGFCVDGICCATACAGTCKACNLPNSLGECAFVPAGVKPSDPLQCSAERAATCGQDGTCNGAGGCRKHVEGTECKPGVCAGDSVSGALTCDGEGSCSRSASTPCYPYSCDPATNQCATECSTNGQCAAGQSCLAQSCGKKLTGSVSKTGGECLSNYSADGFCCNVACTGPCVSCKLPGSVGRCKFIDPGVPDPECPASSPLTCGTTGLCDGSGACAIFPANTPCGAASCSGGVLSETTPTCDGKGTCQAAQLVDCSPYLCSGGACNGSCTTDNDCEPGHACVPTQVRGMGTGACGKKKNGQPCVDASECNSNECVDGFCCESSCDGACRSCGLPGSLGQCVESAAGTPDPRNVCSDQGKASCGTNGMCDGSGVCQRYPVGFACGPETCLQGAFTPPATCNASGQCVTPPAHTCNPYICNGQVCYNSCTSDSAQCAPDQFCVNGSCGLKPLGADCGVGAECQSGNCAQGVCCNSACTEACMACSLSASLGLCTAVPDSSPDPQGQCIVTPASSCGTTGLCKSGSCAYVPEGNNCMVSSCATGSSETPASTCDGLGTCVTPPPKSCGTFICSSAVCENTCKTDNDCVAPNTCVISSCGLKPTGAACTEGGQCDSTFCTEGICCNTACSDAKTGSLCMSCKVSGKVGTCSPVAAGGADPKKLCTPSNALGGDCSNDGTCNGAGACRPWSTATGCRLASCTGSTLTPSANCDGVGHCPAATTQPCDPYQCNSTSPSCLRTCASDANCTGGETCLKTTNTCGTKLPIGQDCKADSDCTSNFCTSEGFCCNSACTDACQSCVISQKVGTCTPIAVNGTPRDATTCKASSLCGNTTKCDGHGGCQLTSAGASCGTASCASPVSGTLDGATVSESLAMISAPTCNGTGTCVPGTVVSCEKFQCDASTATCKTTCSSTSADCNALAPSTADPKGGNSCVSSTCQTKPNGSACSNDFACVSGHCVDGVCCGTASCGTCLACNIVNSSGNLDGVCRSVAAGAVEPHALCAVTPNTSCGTDGKCNGAGVCERWNGGTCAPTSGCADVHDKVSATGTCNGNGACVAGAPVPCSTGFLCVSGACASDCTAQNESTNCDTTDGFTCIGGSCQKIGQGSSCTSGAQCLTGNCVDGVCCASASCTDCSSCNVGGSVGVCHAVAAGTADGICVATCLSGKPTEMSGLCDGSGACRGPTGCQAGYLCTGGSCATNCTADHASTNCDTVSGYGCIGTLCQKAGQGSACTASNQCANGSCVDGICCATATCGTCQACNVKNTSGILDGVCRGVGAGVVEPHNLCSVTASSGCGTDGKCTANALCEQWISSACMAPPTTCPSDTHLKFTTDGICNGAGACSSSGATAACPAGTLCVGSACATSCTTENQGTNCDTLAGYACMGGVCQKAGQGAACTANNQCANGQCVDGTCCASATCGTCQACNVKNASGVLDGVCRGVGAGVVEPHALCTPTASSGCGLDGKCTASNTCEQWSGSVCTAATPTTCPTDAHSKFTTDGTCNGAGACLSSGTTAACPIGTLCVGGSCAGDCTPANASTHCDTAAGYSCIGGLCQKAGLGAACTASNQCAAGNCVDGFCCDGTCTGACQTCAATPGTCTVTTIPRSPSSCPITPCGTTGSCNAGGGCQSHQPGDPCGSPTCQDTTTLVTPTCGNDGACSAQTITTCTVCSAGVCPQG